MLLAGVLCKVQWRNFIDALVNDGHMAKYLYYTIERKGKYLYK